MLAKSNSTIYSTFKKGKQDSFADILKSTKSIIRNSSSFNKYITHYTSSIQISTFKSPDRSTYPILKNNDIIPLHKTTFNNTDDAHHLFKSKKVINSFTTEDKDKDKKQNKPLFKLKLPEVTKVNDDNDEPQRHFNHQNTSKKIQRKITKSSSALSLLVKGMKHNINCFSHNNRNSLCSQSSTLNACHINKRDILIQDFMYKWKHYKDLKQYDENEIFNAKQLSYDMLIKDKIKEITQDNPIKIQNLTTSLESTFEDANSNQIYLKLTSMQIIFTPIQNTNKKVKSTVINLPFSYLFLFYYNDIDFFKYILMSSISFKNNNSEIIFNENNIYSFMKKNFHSIHENTNSSTYNNNNIHFKHNHHTDEDLLKLHTNNNNNPHHKSPVSPRKATSSVVLRKSAPHRFKFSSTNNINNYNEDIVATNNQNETKVKPKHKKRTLIHNSQRKIRKFFYNTYIFIWVTPYVNYYVTITTPRIYFEFETGKNPVSRYIEKELMLFLWERNFVNWDYYIMCYLFSLKRFRIYIENIHSKKISNFLDNILSNNEAAKKLNSYIEKNEYDNSVIPLSLTKKFQFNMKHVKMFFFNTDDTGTNNIINLISYSLFIENDKLNPFTNWTFNLNFAEMKFLNTVSLYEALEMFIMKIIKTDSSQGFLTLDFTVFKDFNAKILDYTRHHYTNITIDNKKDTVYNNIRKPSKNFTRDFKNELRHISTNPTLIHAQNQEIHESNTNEEVCLDINQPFLEVESFDFNGIINKVKYHLEIDLLREMEKMKFIEWPKYLWTNKIRWQDIDESCDKIELLDLKKIKPHKKESMFKSKEILSPKNYKGIRSFEHSNTAFIVENNKKINVKE